VATDCPQLHLAVTQHEALTRLDQHLDRMSGAANARLWTEQAMRSGAAVRALAQDALAALGAPIDPPPPSSAVYVRDRAT
jgi:hypothetical protein